jgi:hypothetical protein
MMKYIMTKSIAKQEEDNLNEEEEEIKQPRKRGFKEYAIGMISVMAYIFFIIFAGSNLLKTAEYYGTSNGAIELIKDFPIAGDKFTSKWTKSVKPTESPFHFVINSIVRSNLQVANYIVFKLYSSIIKISPWSSKLVGGIFYIFLIPLIISLLILLFVIGPFISIAVTSESILMDIMDIPSIVNSFLDGEIKNFADVITDFDAGDAAATATADTELIEGVAEIAEGAAEADVGGIVLIILAIIASIVYFIFILLGLGTVVTNSIAVFTAFIAFVTFYTNYSISGSFAAWGMVLLLFLGNFTSPFGIASLYQVFGSFISIFINIKSNKQLKNSNPLMDNVEAIGLFGIILSIITAFVNLGKVESISFSIGSAIVFLYTIYNNHISH